MIIFRITSYTVVSYRDPKNAFRFASQELCAHVCWIKSAQHTSIEEVRVGSWAVPSTQKLALYTRNEFVEIKNEKLENKNT